MKRASRTIAGLCLALAELSLGACAGTFDQPFFSYGATQGYGGGYGGTQSYGQNRAYEYRDPYTWQRPYGTPGMGQRPYWNAPQSRAYSPDSGVRCDRRKEVCYKWHNKSREWRPDRSDTKDNFGKKAARRLNQ